MNDKLAQTLGIKFIEKKRSAGRAVDVAITKQSKCYAFSFDAKAGKKLGEYVRVAHSKSRIYIAPGCRDKYGFKVTQHAQGKRKYVHVAIDSIGFIDAFIGDHKLKYDADLDVYYITEDE